jgi:hypothetical protein
MSSLLVFNRVYRLELQSVMLVISTPLVNQRPSNLLIDSPSTSSGSVNISNGSGSAILNYGAGSGSQLITDESGTLSND